MSLEKLLFGGRGPSTPPTTDLDGVVTSASPYLVQCTGEDEAGEVIPLMAKAAIGARVVILSVGRRRYAIPAAV